MERKDITIKEMSAQDLDQVHSIETFSLYPWSKKMFAEELENPFACCFVAKDKMCLGIEILGYICFRNIGEESELLNIAVHPERRRLGIGKKLMQFYVDFCMTRRIKSFYLEVSASNPAAIRLYESFSYQPAGVRKKFYQAKSDALLMVRETESL